MKNAQLNQNKLVSTKDLSKDGIELAAFRATQDVRDGNQSPLEAYIMAYGLEALAKKVKELVRDEATDLAQKDRGESMWGVEYSTANGKEVWDYTGDDEWNELQLEKKKLAAKITKRQNFLKSLAGLKDNLANTGTGEIIAPAVQTSMGGTIIKITMPKATHR